MIRKIRENNGAFNIPEDVQDFSGTNGESTIIMNLARESHITACFFANESVSDIRFTELLNVASFD